MERDEVGYVRHMLETAQRVVEKVRGRTRADLGTDEDLRIVLAHRIQVIGGAVLAAWGRGRAAPETE